MEGRTVFEREELLSTKKGTRVTENNSFMNRQKRRDKQTEKEQDQKDLYISDIYDIILLVWRNFMEVRGSIGKHQRSKKSVIEMLSRQRLVLIAENYTKKIIPLIFYEFYET